MLAFPSPPGPNWTADMHALEARIAAHMFDPGDPLGFTRRLARDHGWTAAFAAKAVREYGRFCFLAVALSDPVTPSEEVDEVWHLHLTYSRDYWAVWCRDVLRSDFYHDPTRGGPVERTRFRAQYVETLAAYETFFGPPPPELWPATHRRFGARPRYRILDTHRCLVLARPGVLFRRN